MSHWIAAHLGLLLAIPLAVSFVLLALRNSQRGIAGALAVGGQLVALLLALAAFGATLPFPTERVFQNFTWFQFGEQTLRLGFVLDPLAGVMLVMITFV